MGNSNRIIKFRAWDKKRSYFHWGISNICLTLGGDIMWQFGESAPDFLDKEETQNYVLQQYTGLKDKNGKEIYEGDILIPGEKCHPRIIKWSPSSHGFEWFYSGNFERFWNSDATDWQLSEVIGNIYENPELFKEQ